MAKPLSKLSKLPLTKRVVAQSFVDPDSSTFLNQTQSYLKAHPHSSEPAARVSGHRVLTDANVRLAVDEALQAQGITKEWGEQKLVKYVEEEEKQSNYGSAAKIVMDCMKLGGHVVERQEVKDITNEEKDTMRRIVNEAMKHAN